MTTEETKTIVELHDREILLEAMSMSNDNADGFLDPDKSISSTMPLSNLELLSELQLANKSNGGRIYKGSDYIKKNKKPVPKAAAYKRKRSNKLQKQGRKKNRKK